MYYFEEKSEWLKNLEEDLHESLSGDRVYDSLEDLLTNGRKKRDKLPTNLKTTSWIAVLKRGYMLQKEDEDGRRSLLIPLEIGEDYERYVECSLTDCIVDGVKILVDTAGVYDDVLALEGGLEILCIRGEVVRENIEKDEEPSKEEKFLGDAAFVFNAWNYPGRAPGYHRKMQNKLRKEWPVLAAALDRL